MNAIILAGGREGSINNQQGGKALIPLKGSPMIQYVINALKSSHIINSVLVVGDVELLQPIIGDEVEYIIEDQNDIMDNIMYALSYFRKDDRVLIATCDVPLLKGDMVTDFISRGLELKADLLYPIAERNDCSLRYPDVKRTYATLVEGAYTGGNLFILAPKSVDTLVAIGRHMIENRKKPLKMAGFLGIGIIVKFIFKKLSIVDIEGYIKRRFGVEARALVCKSPELCHDLDRIEDIEVFEKYL